MFNKLTLKLRLSQIAAES